MRTLSFVAAATLALVLGGRGDAAAASFNCAEASSPDERAICADPNLSALDSEMGGLWFAYSRIPMLMGANGDRQDDARTFLATRAKCGADTGCLNALYRARITALQRQIGTTLEALGVEAGLTAPPAAAP